MKISKDPFGLKGYLEVEDFYRVGSKSSKLSPNSSGKAEISVPVAWKPNEPFEIQLSMEVEYELLKVGGVDFWDIQMAYFGTGEFGAMAKWRANLTEDGLELQAIGSGPSGSPKSKDDIAVAIGGALISQSFAKERGPFAKFEVILLAGTMPPVVKVLKFTAGPYDHSKTKTDAIKKSSISGYYTWANFRDAITKLPQATLDDWGKKDPQILGGKTIKNTGYADTTSPMSTGLRTDANPVT